MAFLNEERLQYLWSKVVDGLKTKADRNHKHKIGEIKDLQDILDRVPAVTDEDNGAILRVVDGTWTAVQIPNIEEGEF